MVRVVRFLRQPPRGKARRAWLARRPRSVSGAAGVLAVLQICAIVVLGGVSVAKFQTLALDEGAHFAYVSEIAEYGRLPWLGRDPTPWQVQAMAVGAYPKHSPIPTSRIGLAGENYEGFQPPLYYVLATPAYLVGWNFMAKVRLLRVFDVLLLLAGTGILALLARAVFARRWLVPYCMALAVVMWPGVLVRCITISNEALELPIVLLFVLACWNASTRLSARWTVASGALLGACLLTSLTLVWLVPLLVLPLVTTLRGAPRTRHAAALTAVTAALPLVMIAPWLASNQTRYGALTAAKLVKQEQKQEINPTGQHYGLGFVVTSAWQTNHAVLPQEWWGEFRGSGGIALRTIAVLLVLAGLLAVLRRGRSMLSREALLLGAPWAIGMIMLAAAVLIEQWPVLLPRYLNPALVLLGLLAVSAPTTRRGSTLALAGAGTLTLIIAAVWVYMACAFLFPGIGAHFGIRA